MSESDETKADFERVLAGEGPHKVDLKLFIAGMGPRSTRAIADLGRLCKQFGERCNVEIVDIYEHPAAAAAAQVVAVPALVRNRPLPARRLVGSITDTLNVAQSLGLRSGRLKEAT